MDRFDGVTEKQEKLHDADGMFETALHGGQEAHEQRCSSAG